METNFHLNRARKLANILDSKFRIGKISFGLDPLLSVLPGLGSVLGALTSLYVFWIANRLNVSLSVYIKLALNIFVDFLLGGIPIVGVFVDIFYKSNLKNITLLEQYTKLDKSNIIDAEIIE